MYLYIDLLNGKPLILIKTYNVHINTDVEGTPRKNMEFLQVQILTDPRSKKTSDNYITCTHLPLNVILHISDLLKLKTLKNNLHPIIHYPVQSLF